MVPKRENMTVHALIFEKYPKQKALLWFSVKNDLIYVRGEDGVLHLVTPKITWKLSCLLTSPSVPATIFP